MRSFRLAWSYLGLAVLCLALGVYLLVTDALEAAQTMFMVATGSAMLAISGEERVLEAGLGHALRYGGMGVILLAVVIEIWRLL